MLMPKQLYELIWTVHCMEFEFVQSDLKVFISRDEADRYGEQRMEEWNDGLPPEDKASEGYYFKYIGALPVNEVDGHRVVILDKSANGPDSG